jgi:allophanate hydrolase
MDLCAIALPSGFRANGLPFGITLIGQAFQDAALCELGDRYHYHIETTYGKTTPVRISA